MSREEVYRAYIRSADWRRVRDRYWRSGLPKVCQGCGAIEGLHLHHRTYKRLGAERLTDLVPLCESCHAEVHRGSGKDLWSVTHKVVKRLRRRHGLTGSDVA